VNTIIALGLPEGSVSALVFAFGLMMMPQMAIAQSTAIAALPTFSIQASQGRLNELKTSLSATLRGIILLSMPAAIGLILLRQPLVVFLYQRGEFDENSTALVAWALAWYAAGLVGHSLLELLSRAFYALHDTRTPVSVGVIAMTLNIVLSFGMAELFKRVGWMPHGGLALANSLATALEVITLYVLLRKRLGGLNDRGFFLAFLQSGLGALGMSIIVVIWDHSMGESIVLLAVLGGVFLGAVVYGLILMLIKTPEVGQAIRAVKRRFRQTQ
jgi:putative peptidoglycan lipid II flippase